MTIKQKNCTIEFVKPEVCTVFLQGAKIEDIEISQVGNDVCIENTSNKFPCQKIKKKEKGFSKNTVRKFWDEK